MTNTIQIVNGQYRGQDVVNETMELVRPVKKGSKGYFVTVKSNGSVAAKGNTIRVLLESPDDIRKAEETKPLETDEQVIERIEQRFQILEDMTAASICGDVRAMIVTGPPGVGKSYGVEHQLDRASLFDEVASRPKRFEVVKGAMTPIGLYCTLYRYSDAGNVLVFDDCDSILMDDLSLNILKAALDSGKKRRIFWNSDSHKLRNEGVPDQFDFKGSAIFITNIKFENVKSKRLQDHLEALQSRCHYLDLTLDTMRDKILRIKQIFNKGDLFVDYGFSKETGDEIIEFMDQNKTRLREVSLRMALKIADLTKVHKNWRALAESTCMYNRKA